MNEDRYPALLETLQNALGLLELESSHPLRQTAIALEQSHNHPTFRIAVFGPFNYGKSTLLNAILGDRTLPIDLIPTTGAAISVRYGAHLRTAIHLKTGQTITADNVKILKDYAILDEQRRMREDVSAVEVYCPHPWLATGVELLDLPGTDDREAQDALVRDRLLTADLVVQVLDGRKMMTLGEREHLRDWLLDRNIETVVFVVNFLNLLEPEEQKQVASRMRFVAESFRAKLPPGVSNLYRVDALPALRSRLKGDMAAAQTSGLTTFESALQTIAQQHSQSQQISPRQQRELNQLLQQVQTAVQLKIATVEQTIQRSTQQRSDHRLEVQRKAQTLIQTGYRDSMAQLRQWLELPHLYQTYEASFFTALGRFDGEDWIRHTLRADWDKACQELMGWVYRSCDFFKLPRPVALGFEFPPVPTVQVPESSSSPSPSSTSNELSPVAIATGLGWLVGGPVGAAVMGGASYLLNQIPGSESPTANPSSSTLNEWDVACFAAVRTYLQQFHQRAIVAVEAYESQVHSIIHCPLAVNPPSLDSPQHHYLNLLRSTEMALAQAVV